MTLDPQPVSFDVALDEIDAPVAIEFSGGDNIGVLTVSKTHPGFVTIKLVRDRDVDPVTVTGLHAHRTLGDIAATVLKDKATRAFLLPHGSVSSDVTAFPHFARAMGLLGVLAGVTMTVALMPGGPLRSVLLAGWLVITTLLFAWRLKPSVTHHFVSGEERVAFQSLLDDRPAITQAAGDVDTVKEEYGALLSDLIYRIENPALFDVAVGPTSEFTAALLQWDNAVGSLTGAEASTLAARVRVTFDAAKANAETLGISHIPAQSREDAERAAKALRLAARSNNDAERAAARTSAIRILSSLALYYLPDPDEARTMLEGRRILALPGRRTPRVEQ